MWVFEKMLPGCCVWECELLLTAKKLYEASWGLFTHKSKAITPETSSFDWFWVRSHRGFNC